MKVSEISRPVKVNIENWLNGEISTYKDVVYTDTNELVDIFLLSLLFTTEKKSENSSNKLEIDFNPFIAEESYTRFNNLTYSLGKLLRLSELIYDKLRGVLKNYLSLYSID